MHVTISIKDKQTKMFARVMNLVIHHLRDNKEEIKKSEINKRAIWA